MSGMGSDHLYRWVSSGGGPLIAVPESVLDVWGGSPPDSPHVRGDYGRACAIDGEVGLVPVGDPPVPALVFGEEPSNTTYLPGRQMFVRWDAADTEQAILDGLDAALDTAEWQDGPVWVVSGPVVLFDSAYAGTDLEPRNHLRVDLEPGSYYLRTAYLHIDDETHVVIVQPRGNPD